MNTLDRDYIYSQATKYILELKPKHLQNVITTDYHEFEINFLKNPCNLIEVFLKFRFKTDQELKALAEYTEYL